MCEERIDFTFDVIYNKGSLAMLETMVYGYSTFLISDLNHVVRTIPDCVMETASRVIRFIQKAHVVCT